MSLISNYFSSAYTVVRAFHDIFTFGLGFRNLAYKIILNINILILKSPFSISKKLSFLKFNILNFDKNNTCDTDLVYYIPYITTADINVLF